MLQANKYGQKTALQDSNDHLLLYTTARYVTTVGAKLDESNQMNWGIQQRQFWARSGHKQPTIVTLFVTLLHCKVKQLEPT